MICSLFTTVDLLYAVKDTVKVLSIFIIYRIFHLECHFKVSVKRNFGLLFYCHI